MSNTTRRSGTVSEKMSFGVIVKFDDGQDGLLHVTRMRGGSRQARNRRNQRLGVGAAVAVDTVPGPAANSRKVTLSELWHDDMVLAELKAGAKVRAEVACRGRVRAR